jgi:hypothetical protein
VPNNIVLRTNWFLHFSIVRKSKITTFRKLDLLPSSGEGGGRQLLCWVP